MNKENYINITPNDSRWYILDNLPNEYWKWIPFAIGYYMISNYSRILSIGRNGNGWHQNLIIKPSIKKDGYYQVVLNVKGKHYYKRVNRLVAETFLDNLRELPIVDHKDNNKLNNCLYNLEWVSFAENNKRFYKNYYVSKYKGRGKIKPKKINQYDINGVLIKTYSSVTEASNIVYGTKQKRGSISNACRHNKPYLGYVWKYDKGGDVE